MISTPNSAGQWAVVPLAGVHTDFETWMASCKFDKNAYRGIKGAAKPPAQPRPSRRSFQRQLMLTPPTSPNSSSRRKRNTTTPTPSLPPTLTLSSSSTTTTSSLSTSSEPQPLFTTDYFEVRKSPKGGYGAFAIKDIEKDTVIMSEAPLFRAAFMEVFSRFEVLPKPLRDEYKTLVGWRELSPHEVLAIFKTNRFETSDGRGGIFLKSSRFNHACHPYATCTYLYEPTKDRLIVTSLLPIAKGQEITISYTKSPEMLYPNYGFYCDCPGCPPAEKAKKHAAFLKGPN